MFKFSPLLLAVALSASVVLPARAQTPSSAPRPPSPSATASQGAPSAPAGQPPSPSAPASQGLPAVRTVGSGTVCGLSIPTPANLPPAGSAPVVYQVVPCFQKQGGTSVVEPYTYLYYIEMKNHVSVPSANRWVPYDDKIEQVALADFKRLWATNFLDDLAIDVQDYKFSNGVIGKMVVYDMEERQRVKIVDYVGSKKVEQSKIDEELKKKNLQIRLDSFIDQGLIRKVAGVVRDIYAEKGFEYAEVKPEIKPVSTATKTVNLTFHITEGPKVKIRVVDFQGNKAIADGKLGSKMKENKAPGMFKFITGAGTYKEGKFEEDADKVVQYYRERGYVKAQVGQPELKILEDAKDGKTRWVELQIPVTEGPRYKVGEITFSGNTVVTTETLRPLFKLDAGDWFNEKKIRKGFEKAREIYGTGGYFEFTGVPEYAFPNDPNASNGPNAPGPADGAGSDTTAGPPAPPATAAGPPAPAAAPAGPPTPAAAPVPALNPKLKALGDKPVVNIVMRLDQGKQYSVNRIIFLGNTTTRDNVIRREIRLYEGGVFNTEALKYSVRRLNQLGYFKPLEGEAIDVQKTPDKDAQVDVRLKFEEQNRNQITFGAGVSQYEGFFGQLAFQTSNFLGRGETFSVSAQQGNRAKNYQVGFTEPFLFDRPITAGIDVFKQEIQYIGQFTQASSGMNTVWGFPAGAFSRLFVSYSYQRVQVKDLNPLFQQQSTLVNNPFLADSLLLSEGGQRRISKIGPSYLFNTIDNPIFPTAGKKLSLAVELAGLGGNSKFYTAKTEGIWYKALNRRTSLGLRAAFEFIDPYGSTKALPIFEKLFLGGEYSIRGFDIRSVGPRDLASGIVIGGNKSLLFNAEYLINIAGPVRLVLFADAGQVRDRGESFGWKEPVTRLTTIGALGPADALTAIYGVSGFNNLLPTRLDTLGETNAFKTSMGAEIRFFMPVLNVPFRLIFAANPSRVGVLDNNLRPEKLFKFRFAVGTTF
jgi:outer membrane protein insertion porin family